MKGAWSERRDRALKTFLAVDLNLGSIESKESADVGVRSSLEVLLVHLQTWKGVM